MRRLRIHPAVACTAIVCITVLAVTAQHYGNDTTWKIIAASIIAWILGVKLRHILPVT